MSYAKSARRGIAAFHRRQTRNARHLKYHQMTMTTHEKGLKMNAEFDRKAKWGKKQ